MIESRVGVLDVIGSASLQNTCLVLPTLEHAIALWPKYREAAEAVHKGRVKKTKTAVYMYRTRTTLRLWVPYSREPTMPLDVELWRRGFYFMTPYNAWDVSW